MTRMTDSREVSARYDEDYFFGKTSGYPAAGYRNAHSDWRPWLDFLSLIKPSGVLLDLGCAFGYLVEESRGRGYQSFGVDVSRYALRQEPSLWPWLVQASLERLPVASESADVIVLFDVLEHLEQPLECLAEVRRALKPDGLVVASTPDPIFFTRPEPTHVFERPPSFWLAALRRLGLAVQFRFSVEAYNFQFVAAVEGSATAARLSLFQHDYFEARQDFVLVEGPVTAVPRQGWGALSAVGRNLASSPASIYLLNPQKSPCTISVRLLLRHTAEFSTLRVRLNSNVLSEIFLDSESDRREVVSDDVLLPSGGNHLFLDVFPGGPRIEVESVFIEARLANSDTLRLSLPFDLFQRYAATAELARAVRPQSVLDIGGYLGDENGHLATPGDFFGCDPEGGAISVEATDLRQCDHPHHQPAQAWEQPFADQSFDLVTCLDVLEHIHPGRRPDFLAELDRVAGRWIVLGAPFWSPAVLAAETEVGDAIASARRFLAEHLTLGLPREDDVLRFFEDRGYRTFRIPNGYLPRWKWMQLLTFHYFNFNDYRAIREFNTLCNAHGFSYDQAEPCYRVLFLISKGPLESREVEAIASIVDRPAEADARAFWGRFLEAALESGAFVRLHNRIAALLAEQRKALSDAQFIVNERQKAIAHLEREISGTPLWRLALRRLRKKFREAIRR